MAFSWASWVQMPDTCGEGVSYVGFTGTQRGMTDAQRAAVRQLIRNRAVSFAVHGGCVGADFDFHELVRSCTPQAVVWVRPAWMPEKWPTPILAASAHKAVVNGRTVSLRTVESLNDAWFHIGAKRVFPPAANPLDRNVDMVRDIAKFKGWWIATPKLMVEELRSGTWHCIRRVRKAGIPLSIVWPTGEIDE